MARLRIPADSVLRIAHAPGAPVDVEIQNIGPNSIFVADRQSELFRVDAGGNPFSGQEITSAMGIIRKESFRGSLWARTSIAHDIEVQINET